MYNINQSIIIIQLTKYNMTGYVTESWDKPTSPSNCHHACLSGNAWVPRGPRPFVGHLRTQFTLRMRHLTSGHAQESRCGTGPTLGMPRTLTHAQDTSSDPRRGALASPQRVTQESCSRHDLNNKSYETQIYTKLIRKWEST